METATNKKVLVSYLGRTGAGLLDTYETTKALIDNGYDVYVLLSDYIQEKNVWNSLAAQKVCYLRTYKGAFDYIIQSIRMVFWGQKELKRLLGVDEFDYQFMPMLFMWSGILLKNLKCERSFVVFHDVIPHAGTKKYVTHKFLSFAKKATDIIVHSPHYVEQIKMFVNKNCSIHYYPLGDHTAYYDAIMPQKKVVTYDDNKINFLFFGTIMEYKGLGLLLDAYKQVKNRYSNVSLTIVGGGDLSIYEEKLSELEDITIVNRFIDDNEVRSVFDGSNLITVTPYINASQSGPIMLAMGYQSLVITSDCEGLVNQVENGKYGLIFKEKDTGDLIRKMEQAIQDEKLRKEIVQSAYEHNKKISWSESIKKMMKELI